MAKKDVITEVERENEIKLGRPKQPARPAAKPTFYTKLFEHRRTSRR